MSTPPWEDLDVPIPTNDEAGDLDVCDATGYVTQGQFAALLQMVKDQRKLIDRLNVQMAGLVNKNPGRPNPPSQPVENYSGDTLLRGKYEGCTHDQVVLKAPDYVMYLANNNWHVRWGFTDRHIEAAKKAVELGISSRN